MEELINEGIGKLVSNGTGVLLTIMVVSFVFAIFFRALIYHAIRREHWFARHFEKSVDKFLLEIENKKEPISFYVTTKRLLERCY